MRQSTKAKLKELKGKGRNTRKVMKAKPKKSAKPKPAKKVSPKNGGFNAAKYKKTHAQVFGIKEDKGLI